MADIPIIFSAPMILALLDGRKTMTRRLRWQGRKAADGVGFIESPWARVKPGDRLWVRESYWRWGRWYKYGKTKAGRQQWRFKVIANPLVIPVVYNEPPGPKPLRETIGFHKRPSIFLPREHSRLTLTVTATKIERLQLITDADAQAEGIVEDDGSEPDIWYVPGASAAGLKIDMADRPSKVFPSLWRSLHGPATWDTNPKVVALTFTVNQHNIDAMSKAAA